MKTANQDVCASSESADGLLVKTANEDVFASLLSEGCKSSYITRIGATAASSAWGGYLNTSCVKHLGSHGCHTRHGSAKQLNAQLRKAEEVESQDEVFLANHAQEA